MKYRAAIKSDVEQIALLHADSWKRTYKGVFRDEFLDGDVVADRLKVWNDRLGQERADQFVWVIEEQARLLGFICAYGNEDSKWGSLIDNLYVAHDCMRRGLGTLLMQEMGSWLQARYGQLGIYLWVLAANQSARHFYENWARRMRVPRREITWAEVPQKIAGTYGPIRRYFPC